MNRLKEAAKSVKIIFFDIDDTLRNSKTGLLPESVYLAFDKLRERGILTGIATGRNLYGVVPEVKALKPDYYVTINGAYVEKSDGELIYKRPYPTELVEEIIDWLSSVGSDYGFVGGHDLAVSNWDEAAIEAIEHIYGVLPVDPDYYKENDVFQILSISKHDQSVKLPSGLVSKIRMVRWHPYSSDIIPMKGSKADGVSKILIKLGLTAENLMNFGDEMNDAELFDLAGLSVAMERSHPTILKKADYVTASLENNGIYKALLELGIIE